MIPEEIQTLEIELTDDEKRMIATFEKEISKPVIKPSVPVSKPPASKGESHISETEKKTSEQKGLDELIKENGEIEESQDRARTNAPKAKREFRVITDEERPQDLRTN